MTHSFMFHMNAYQCEVFHRFFKEVKPSISYKFFEMGLMNKTDESFENFMATICERVMMADLTDSTRTRYLRSIQNEVSKYEILFDHLQSIV